MSRVLSIVHHVSLAMSAAGSGITNTRAWGKEQKMVHNQPTMSEREEKACTSWNDANDCVDDPDVGEKKRKDWSGGKVGREIPHSRAKYSLMALLHG